MLQRVQAVLTVVLLGAVIFMGAALYRGQQANEAATARVLETLDRVAKQPATVSPLPLGEGPGLRAGPQPRKEYGYRSSRDAKLSEMQRLYREKIEEGFKTLLYPPYVNRDSEETYIKSLSDEDQQTRIAAINALAVMGSKKAVPGLLKIAADRAEKDNRDRWMAVRALGIIGDGSVVPELVHLTYHYNQNTRFWAQISLVRLTGENFGRDVAAWKAWWEKQGKEPPISTETVAWATSPEMVQYTDPKKQDEFDAIAAKPEGNSAGTGPSVVTTIPKTEATVDGAAKHRPGVPLDKDQPKIVSVSPAPNATAVDPITEIRIRFDRPMDPNRMGLRAGFGNVRTPFRLRGSPKYVADTNEFVLPVILRAGADMSLTS